MKKIHILLVAFLVLMPIFNAEAQTVDILWQADTYTSPFYKGRALWSNQSIINFVAIPQGFASNPSNLFYKWTRNGTVLGNTNGVGRNTLTYADSVLSRPQIIQVEILGSNQETVLASASVNVAPIPPTLAVYENNPLYGYMFHKETPGTHQLREREITFTAFPFYFSTFNRISKPIGYVWRTNAGGLETSNSVTYRTPDDAAGASEVEVQVSNADKIMQTATKNFLVQFEEIN